MADLDKLEQDVAQLDEDLSTIFEFRDVYLDIETAGKNTNNDEINKLRGILSGYRNKLPNKVALNPIRSRATDLADALMLATLTERIKRINDRNQALTNLNGALDVQIQKGNADAAKLQDIKDEINKAATTVTVIRNMINALSNATPKESLIALVNALDAISSIFEQ